jgi:hypothetical protein
MWNFRFLDKFASACKAQQIEEASSVLDGKAFLASGACVFAEISRFHLICIGYGFND